MLIKYEKIKCNRDIYIYCVYIYIYTIYKPPHFKTPPHTTGAIIGSTI